jgi:hypothetical protein
LSVDTCLFVGVSDLLQLCRLITLPVGVPEIGLRIVELVDDCAEIIAELSGPVWLIATLEVSQETCDYCIGGTKEDCCSPSSAVVECTQGSKTGRNENLEKEQ